MLSIKLFISQMPLLYGHELKSHRNSILWFCEALLNLQKDYMAVFEMKIH